MDYVRQSRMLFRILIIAVFLSFPVISLATSEQSGWSLLWGNKFLEAEKEFELAIQTDKNNMSAYRGLLLSRSALGRDNSLMEDLKTYSRGAPHSDYDLLLIDWLDAHNSLGNKAYYEVLTEVAKNFAEAKDLDLTDRRIALDDLLEYHRLLGEINDVKKTADKLNRITDWMILGPFDNTAGSGHIKDFIEVDRLDTSVQYVGKYGQRISWFTPSLVDIGGDIAPLAYFFQKANTTGYARTQVRLRSAGKYLLSMGCLGDLDVYLNGVLVIQRGRSGGGGEIVQELVDLPAGWTNIACKVSNRNRYAGFTCSLSMADGSEIDGLEIDPTMDGHVISESGQTQSLESDMLAGIGRRAAEDSTDPENAFWNLQRVRRGGDQEEMIAQCKFLLGNFGDVGLIRLAVLELYESLDMSTERVLRETLELSPELAGAKLIQAKAEMEKKRFKAARTLAEEVLEIAKDCGEAQSVRINSLIADQLWSDLREAAYKAQVVFPTESFPYFAYERYEEEMGSKSDARKYRKQALNFMLPGSRQELSFLYDWEKEDYKEAKDTVKKLVEADPSSSWKWNIFIYSLLASEDYDQAFETTRSCLESFPQDVGMISTMAQFVESGFVLTDDEYRNVMRTSTRNSLGGMSFYSLGDDRTREILKQEAAFLLKRAINSDPGNMELRERAANLQGRKPFRTILPDPEVSDVEAMKVDKALYPGEDSVILLNQKRRLVFEQGVSLLDHVLAVQILNEDGIAQWENLDIPYSIFDDIVVLRKSILKSDGAEEDGRQYLNKFMFPNLETGDLILVHYQTTKISTGKLFYNFWDQFYFVSTTAPVVKAEYSLFVPPDQLIQDRLWNVPTSVQTKLPVVDDGFEGFREYRWTLKDQPRAGREIMEPDPKRIYPWLDLSTIPDWGRISEWYLDMSEGQRVVTPDLQAKAEELTAECATNEEKIAAVFDFVSNSITYESVPFFQTAYVPRLPGEVLQDGFGDCKDKSCLMITMLQAIGIPDLHFALVTPEAPSVRPFLPSPRFNHAIVCLDSGNGNLIWYDPTLEKAETGQVPGYLGGTLALVISADSPGLVEIPRENLADRPYESRSRVAIESDGTGRVHQTENYRQIDQLTSLRQQLSGEDGDELMSYMSRILAVQYPGVEVDSIRVDGLEPGQGFIRITTDFQVPDFGFVDQGILSVKIPWSSQLASIYGMVAAEKTRETALDLEALALCENDEVQLILPPNHGLERAPEGVRYVWEGCEYQTSFSGTTEGLVANRKLNIAGDLVSLGEYPEFKIWFDKVRRDLEKTHHLRVR